jgi:hypothetical protein
MAFFGVSPFGPRQEEQRAAVLAERVHNGLMGGRRLAPEDLFPSLKARPSGRDQTPEEIHAAMGAWAQGLEAQGLPRQ